MRQHAVLIGPAQPSMLLPPGQLLGAAPSLACQRPWPWRHVSTGGSKPPKEGSAGNIGKDKGFEESIWADLDLSCAPKELRFGCHHCLHGHLSLPHQVEHIRGAGRLQATA